MNDLDVWHGGQAFVLDDRHNHFAALASRDHKLDLLDRLMRTSHPPVGTGEYHRDLDALRSICDAIAPPADSLIVCGHLMRLYDDQADALEVAR